MFSYLKNLSARPHKKNLKREKEFQSIFNRALTLSEWGMRDVAIPLYLKALKIFPTNDAVHYKLAEAYKLDNQADRAIIHYKECLNINPEDPYGVTLELYLLEETSSLDAIPIKYIERLYDQYAPHFEKNLIDVLSYSAPEAAHALVKRVGIKPCKILDLGCGTGLASAPYKSKAEIIHGVDISSAMLKQAEQKSIYNKLFREDVHAYLEKCEEMYDLILALDLLIYIADIERLFSLVSKRLNEKGVFVMSIQLSEQDCVFGNDHRFSHSEPYLVTVLHRHHMTVIDKEEIILRTEHEVPVSGAVYLCGFKS